MTIGIIGAGKVGQTLGRRFAAVGHVVVYGVRDTERPRPELQHSGASVASVPEAVQRAEVVILATPWAATEAALRSAGDFAGKPLFDATNPIGAGFVLSHGHTDSGGEQVARWATNARVVKVFNIAGAETMADPRYPAGAAAMFVCGDDAMACETALTLARELGFDAVRIGGLVRSRLLEPAAMLWITLAMMPELGRNTAFGLLRRGPTT